MAARPSQTSVSASDRTPSSNPTLTPSRSPLMAKPKVTPTPEGRSIQLKSRQAKVTNLNLKPEASGKDLVARADISIEFLLADKEIDQLVAFEGGAELLWEEAGG